MRPPALARLLSAAVLAGGALLAAAPACPAASTDGVLVPVFSGRAAPRAGAPTLAHRNGDRFLRAGDLRSAAREYAQAALAEPRNPVYRLTLGVTLAALSDVQSAAGQFRAARSVAEDDVIAALLLQGALEEMGRATEAQAVYLDTVRRFTREGKPGLDASVSIGRLRSAVTRFPQSAVLYLLLGDAYQVSEQWAEAEAAYDRSIVLAPAWVKPRVNRGVLHLAQGRAGVAVKDFEQALRIDPANTQVRLLKGDAQNKLGQSGPALDTYRAVANAPRAKKEKAGQVLADAETRIGQVLLQNQQPDDAIRAFSRAQKLAPKNPGPVAGYAEAQVQAGNYREAAEAFRSALRLSRSGGLLATRPVLYRGLAEAQLSAGNPDGALETLRRALAEEPQSAALWHLLWAHAAFAKSDAAEGEAALRRALDSDQGRYPQEALNAIAARGLIARVTEAYEREQTDPLRRAPALIALAHLARYGGDLSREIALREQVTRIQTFAVDWYLLADTYERAGRTAEARDAYSRALERGGLAPPAEEYALGKLKALPAR